MQVFKSIISIFSILFFVMTFASCVTTSGGEGGVRDPRITAALAEITAREIGCEVADNPQLDRIVRSLYTMAKTGEISQEIMDQIAEEAGKYTDRPTLIPNIMSLMKLVGLRFDTNGELLGVGTIDPVIYDAVESGYVSGVRMCTPK